MKYAPFILMLGLLLGGCDQAQEPVNQTSSTPMQCGKDTDCKGDRVCESGQCVNPVSTNHAGITNQTSPIPVAPVVAYEPVVITNYEAGPFVISDDTGYNQLIYQSRAGVTNLMETVADYPDSLGYLGFEKVYFFGPNRYVIIVSTGESGMSCPATTYAISYDIKGEYVVGSTSIDGCSEEVQAFAEGNKLSIKKEGDTTVIYNAEIN